MNSEPLRAYQYRRFIIGSIALVILLTAGMFFAESVDCGETVSVLEEKTFHMVMNRPEGTPYYKWVELIYTEVFRRLEINLRVEYNPLKRASIEANKGRADGEPARIHAYAASFPNLVRVEESIFPMTVVAYTSKTSIPELNGWESLRNTGYFAVYPRGMKICEINLSKTVEPERLSNVTETVQGLRRLVRKRIDVYVDDMNAVLPMLQNEKNKFQGDVRVAGIMQEVPLYMYVHKKHKALVPKLSEVIKTVKSEGLIEQYRKTAFGIRDE